MSDNTLARSISKFSKMRPNIGPVIELELFNKLLFGVKKNFPFIGKMEMLNKMWCFTINNKFYLKMSEIENYIERIKKTNNFDNCFAYNYYKLTGKYDNEKNEKIFRTIDAYIEYLEFVGDQYSKTIKHTLLKNNFLNCELIGSINDTLILGFLKSNNKYLTITFSSTSNENELNYKDINNEEQYEKLYETHKNDLLMDNPEDFLILNLERVTGNIEFSTMAVKSYLEKNKKTVSIDGLAELIEWKNNKKKNEYIDFFKSKYENLIEDDFTNFEGYNKFLLSLEVEYLESWEVKEQYNELYFQITHELIHSFELLYSYTK